MPNLPPDYRATKRIRPAGKSRWREHQAGKTTTQRGYGHAWRKLRKQAMDLTDNLCANCLRNDIYRVATEVDHIIPKAAGGTDELSNLQPLCRVCHKEKTQRDSLG